MAKTKKKRSMGELLSDTCKVKTFKNGKRCVCQTTKGMMRFQKAKVCGLN